MTRKQRRLLLSALFLLPGLAMYTLFVVYPGIQAVRISLFRWNGMSEPEFVGLGNFVRIAQEPLARGALLNNVYLLIVPTIIILVLALLFAELVRSGVWGAKLYQTVFFFPNMLSMVIVGIVWLFALSPNLGLVNGFLRAIGLDVLTRPWLGSPGLVLPVIGGVTVWMAAGYYMVLLIAAMKNIPRDLYECAMLDGAGRIRQFWHISIPMVWEVLQVIIALLLLGAVQQFALVWVLTEGGPNGASEVLSTFMYKQAFRYFNIGLGNAVAVLMFLLVFVFSLIALRTMRRESVEY